jgi:lipopolysaccharide/colanic/teichoic acid biosynthesis glycosyltransferase
VVLAPSLSQARILLEVAAVLVAGAAAAAVFEPLVRGLGWSSRPASFRWAVLAGGVTVSGLQALLRGGLSPWLLAVAFLGAFCGSAVASWLQMGLLEDNYPPTPLVREAVLQAHVARLQASPRLSAAKRAFDIALSAIGLLLSAPLWLLLAAFIWFEQPGPVFFVKNSVGLGGKPFRQWKLRTMVHGAEDASGPVLAREDDARALIVGRWLRKTALDELPQLLNILIGDMSFVGPRPQRTVLVLEYLRVMPEYADRHWVRPGLAGLAQVAGDYYLTPRQKLRLDRLYVQHASLVFDLWLMTLACLVVFWWRWRPGWRGQLTPAQIRGRRRATRTGD